MTEDVFCHPNRSHLLARTKHKDACNFTSLNSGLPWYCGKPIHKLLECNDWKFVRKGTHGINNSLTACEKDLLYLRFVHCDNKN